MSNNLYKLRSFGYVEIDDEIWFPNLHFNALMKVNKLTGRLEIVDKFPNYGVYSERLYSTVCHVNGHLIFVPNRSEEIVSYDIKERKFMSIPLNCEIIGYKTPYFMSAYTQDSYVYMFPMGAACIIRYDVKAHAIQYLQNSISNVIQTMRQNCYSFYQQFEIVDKKIYFPFLDLNAIAILDLCDESVDIKYLNIKGGCSTINYIDGFFYLASWKSARIYRWNAKTGSIQTYCEFPENFTGKQMFLNACRHDDQLFLFPEHANMIVSFSIITGEIQQVQKICNAEKEVVMTYFVKSINNKECVLTADMDTINSIVYIESGFETSPYYQDDALYNRTRITNFLFAEERRELEEYMEKLIVNSQNVVVKTKRYPCGKKIFEQTKIF